MSRLPKRYPRSGGAKKAHFKPGRIERKKHNEDRIVKKAAAAADPVTLPATAQQDANAAPEVSLNSAEGTPDETEPQLPPLSEVECADLVSGFVKMLISEGAEKKDAENLAHELGQLVLQGRATTAVFHTTRRCMKRSNTNTRALRSDYEQRFRQALIKAREEKRDEIASRGDDYELARKIRKAIGAASTTPIDEGDVGGDENEGSKEKVEGVVISGEFSGTGLEGDVHHDDSSDDEKVEPDSELDVSDEDDKLHGYQHAKHNSKRANAKKDAAEEGTDARMGHEDWDELEKMCLIGQITASFVEGGPAAPTPYRHIRCLWDLPQDLWELLLKPEEEHTS